MKPPVLMHAMILTVTTLAICHATPIQANHDPFSRIIVFGDSLSDTGNLYQLTGGYPPPPYADGRFSNGRLWVEHLADDLGMQIDPADNYAVGGATTGAENSNDGLFGLVYPGLQGQIETFVATLPASGADPDALYLLWCGANDFFNALANETAPADLMGIGVSNTVHAVHVLWQSGARHIVVGNIPDLGITPLGLGSVSPALLTQLTDAYNQALQTALSALTHAGIPVITVDAFSTLQAMVGQPEQYGFMNVTQPFLQTGGDPASFLFWDVVHPTTGGHKVLAQEAVRSLLNHYSPHPTDEGPAALAHALNGRVTATEQR